MMQAVLQSVEGVAVYVDDVIIGTVDEESHLQVVEEVLDRFEQGAGVQYEQMPLHVDAPP